MSLIRSIRRADARRRGTFADYKTAHAKPQPTTVDNLGYTTLTPTKGWKRVSNARLVARAIVAHIKSGQKLATFGR